MAPVPGHGPDPRGPRVGLLVPGDRSCPTVPAFVQGLAGLDRRAGRYLARGAPAVARVPAGSRTACSVSPC
ncbi:MAG: hypothetical protein ACK57L_13355, partial [Pseudomonadota bacterium]|jgi:hypothetical protein